MVGFEEMRDELLERIEDLLKRKQYTALRDLLADLEPADIASLFEDLDEDSIPLLFRLLPKEPAAEVFVELDPDAQEMLIRGFSNTELKEVLDELYLDDAVDIVEEMPANVVKRILKHADPDTRKSINEILKYPDDSAGALMTTEFCRLKARYDRRGRAQAYPPHRYGQRDHQRLLCRRSGAQAAGYRLAANDPPLR